MIANYVIYVKNKGKDKGMILYNTLTKEKIKISDIEFEKIKNGDVGN